MGDVRFHQGRRGPGGATSAANVVLLIEEDGGYALEVRQMLGPLVAEGYEVLSVPDTREATRALSETTPVCIVIDLEFANGEGLDVLHALLQAAPDCPVVALAAWSQADIALRAVQLGAQDCLHKERVDRDLLERSVRFAMERKRLETELAHQALHDPLTQLPNRSLFMDRLDVAVARLTRHQSGLCVLFFDVDNFKLVNDGLGHDVGDELLVAIADRLRKVMRSEDTVARIGGDEFCLLCEDVRDQALAREIANRVEGAFATPFTLTGRPVFATASVGLAWAEDSSIPSKELVSDADAAMYKAKERGRNRVELFDQSFRDEVTERLEMENGLRRALEEDEFLLDFQPIMDLKADRIVSVEALVRWQHPERGLLQPASFVSIAEETGLIIPLGRWVLNKAFSEAARWLAATGESEMQVCVNVSPRQLEESDFVSDTERALLKAGLPPRNVILELTESTLMRLSSTASAKLDSLKSLGIKVALDDFGTGYSSLSYLQQFPVDIVKVDRSFVQEIGESPERLAFARAIVTFSSTLQMQTIAEGIEFADQVDCLNDMNCPLGQGFLFSHPMSAADVLGALQTQGPAQIQLPATAPA
jgi:diguanylate cyclase (GGDEF)-like protein